MTAYNTIEKMVRNSHHELKQLGSYESIISDFDKIAEIDDGEERSNKREYVFHNVINYLVNNGIISQHDGFNLMNLTDDEYNEKIIIDNSYNQGGVINVSHNVSILDGYDGDENNDLSIDYDEWSRL